MYAIEVRDHIMIAHSLPGEVFGPAQRLHGATFVVDVASLAGHKTTSEFMARHIFDAIAAAIRAGRRGAGAAGIDRVRVTLNESHVARAWYEAAIGA